MSAVPERLPLPDRFSDSLNPIFVKETRQALKSRQFIATFFLMLVASWLAATFGLMTMGGTAGEERAGPLQFAWYFNILCVTTYVLVPFGAFRSVLAERDQFTYEMLAISTLRPRQIVWGKLLSALLQTFIYYSAITPFVAFTYQLRGIDVITIMFRLIVAMLVSVMLSLFCLAVSTFARRRAEQIILTLVVCILLLVAAFLNFMIFTLEDQQFAFDQAAFWVGCGVIVAYVIPYCVLLLEIAVSQLTFESDNRSTTIRLTVGFLFWMSVGFAALMVYRKWEPDLQQSRLTSLLIFSAIHWGVLGLVAVTERDELALRTARRIRRWGPFRILLAPFLPGGARGLVFVGLHVAALCGMVLWLYHQMFARGTFSPPSRLATLGLTQFQSMVVAVSLYLLVYLGASCALGRWLPKLSPDLRPAHGRVFAILIGSLLAVVPKLIQLGSASTSVSAWHVMGDPISLGAFLAETPDAHEHAVALLTLSIAAFVALLINAPAIFRGLLEVARAAPPVEAKTKES